MALTLKEFRSKHPQYDDMEDEEVARGIHKKLYSGMDWDEFASEIQYVPVVDESPEPPTRTKSWEEFKSEQFQNRSVVDEPVESEDISVSPTRKMGWEEFKSTKLQSPSVADEPADNEDSLITASRNAQRANKTIKNEDGTVSSIRSMSVEDERLNDGKPTLIPSIWDGEQLDPAAATDRAVESGTKWPSYDSNDQATAASKRISSGLGDPRKFDEQQRRERDKIILHAMGREQFVLEYRGITPPKSKSKKERIEDLGAKIARDIEAGWASPEDYYISEQEVDAIMFDTVAFEQKIKKESAEDAVAAGIKLDSAIEGEEVEKSRWLHLKDRIPNVFESMFRGQEVRDAAKLSESARYGALAKLYLERAAEEWPTLSEDKKVLFDDAAEKSGLTGDQYYRFTGAMLESMVNNERATLEGYAEFEKEINKHRVELGKFGLGYLATMAIDNVNNVVYMALAFATKSPQVMAVLMGTDIYVTTYAHARQEGRSMGEASQDAFVSSLIEGATEGLPVLHILKLMKVGNKSGAAKLLSGMGAEGTQELAAEVLQMAYEAGVIGEDITVAEAFTRMRDAGVLGMLFGAAFTTPAAILGDNELSNSNKRINSAKTVLRVMVSKIQAEGDVKGTKASFPDSEFGVLPAESPEAKAAINEYADALNERRGIVQGRLEAQAKKIKAKTEKKETKRKARRTPREVKQEAAKAKAEKADQVVDELTPEIEAEADLIEKVLAREEISPKDVQGLVDKGLAIVTRRGILAVLPAGNRRLTAIKKARENKQVRSEVDEASAAGQADARVDARAETEAAKGLPEVVDASKEPKDFSKRVMELETERKKIFADLDQRVADGELTSEQELESPEYKRALEIGGELREITEERKKRVEAKGREAIRRPKPVAKEPLAVRQAEEAVENRKAELLDKVDPAVKDSVVREKIVESIVKAEQEEAAFEEIEQRAAERISTNMNEDYEQALKEQQDVDAEVALNLAKLDQKNTSGKTGTKLGAVLRGAEKKLKEEADNAKADMDVLTKSNKGKVFDLGGALAQGTAEYANLVKFGAYKLAQHGAKYGAWAADMIGEFGDSIRPVLTRLYRDAKRNVRKVMKWSHARELAASQRSVAGQKKDKESLSGTSMIPSRPTTRTKPKKAARNAAERTADADVAASVDEFMEEYNEETEDNPTVRGERVLSGGAAILLSKSENGIWLDGIRAFDTGTGQGNAALKFLVELADRHGVKLHLFARPFGEVGMDEQGLINWYEFNGFTRTSPGATTMVRLPQYVTRTFSRWARPKTRTNAFWGISMEEADQIVEGFKKELGIENIRVLESIEDLPDKVYGQVIMHGYSRSIQGVFHDDAIDGPTIYVIANNIVNLEGEGGLIEVMLHETIGHFGLQALLGWKKYNQTMDAIIRSMPDEVRKHGRKMHSGLQSRRLAAEEVFAYMVQDELLGKDLSKAQRGFIKRVIAEINLLFVRLGWKQLTHEDMLSLMHQSLRFVKANNTEMLQRRAKKVSNAREARIRQESGESASETFVLKEDNPLLKSFDDKTGYRKVSKVDSLREWMHKKRHGLAQAFEQYMIDRASGIRHLEQELGIEGPASGYMSMRLAAGVDVIIKSAMENAAPAWNIEADGSASVKMDEGEKGLKEVLAPVNSAEDLHLFERFIVANRAIHLLSVGKESLLTREEVNAALADVKKRGKFELFTSVQKDLAEFKSKVLDFAQEAGVIDSVSRKLWERNDHVPFYRVLAKDKDSVFANLTSVRQVIYQQTGSKLDMTPGLENIFDNISMLIEASVRNRAMSDVINQFKDSGMVTRVPDKDLMEAVDVEEWRDAFEQEGIKITDAEILQAVQRYMGVTAKSGDDTVGIQVNGKKEFWYVHDPGVMTGLEVSGTWQLERIMRILRFVKRVLTTIITRVDPRFMLSNWIRDMQHAFILIRHGQYMPWDAVAGWAKAIKGTRHFDEMMAGAGMFDSGYINAGDPKSTLRAMRRRLVKRGRFNIIDNAVKAKDLWVRLTNGAENAARIIIFDKALKKTGSKKQALYDSRDIMDFSVRGSARWLQFFIETVPFLGARIQGASRTWRGFQGRDQILGSVLARGLSMSMSSIGLYLINRDDDRYKSLHEYEKRMYYHFYDVFEEGDVFRLPRGFEIGAIFGSIPEIGMEYMLSEQPDKGKAAAWSLLWVLGQQMDFTPEVQLFKPAVEIIVNKNFYTGAPIERYWETQKDANERYNYKTSKSIVWLAKQMPSWAPDFVRSPRQLQHWLRGYFSVLATFTYGMADRFIFNEGSPTPRLDEGFYGRFYREGHGKFDKYQAAMYDVLDEAEIVQRTISSLRKKDTPAGRIEANQIVLDNRSLLFAGEVFARAIKKIRRFNKRIEAVYANKTMTPDQKREAITGWETRKREVAKKVYPFRPGGSRNKLDKVEGEPEGEPEAIFQWLNEKTKREQVDALIGANLPHTAVLINDVTIGLTKLKSVS